MLAEIIPDCDYRFQMRFTRGSIAEFFAPTVTHGALLAERQHWLRTAPAQHAAILPDGIPILEEAIDLAEELAQCALLPWPARPDSDRAEQRCLALGAWWEPDFLLLKPSVDGQIRLQGGCVCFPSSWSLSEKVGHPIEKIHEPVPGLNEEIGTAIHQFLAKLKPGVAWQRFNWGLSASAELNQHPSRQLPLLADSVNPATAWLRVEHQALVALPRTGGILFGIRIAMEPLDKLKGDEAGRKHLIRALTTMPNTVAAYKGLTAARPALVAFLER